MLSGVLTMSLGLFNTVTTLASNDLGKAGTVGNKALLHGLRDLSALKPGALVK